MPIEALRALTEKQLQERTIEDPKYAGFDPKFDWHTYISIDDLPPALKLEVSASLDLQSKTERFQHSVRQSFAIRASIMKDPTTRQLLNNPAMSAMFANPAFQGTANNPKISIRERPTGQTTVAEGTSTAPVLGIVFIDREEIRLREFLGKDGNYNHVSLHSAIGHEFDHLMDGFYSLPAYRPFLQERAIGFAQELANVYTAAGIRIADPQTLKTSICALPLEKRIRLLQQIFDIAERRDAAVEFTAIIRNNDYQREDLHEPERALTHVNSRIDPAMVPPATTEPLPPGLTPRMAEFCPLPSVKTR